MSNCASPNWGNEAYSHETNYYTINGNDVALRKFSFSLSFDFRVSY